jgi:hypothetical protein
VRCDGAEALSDGKGALHDVVRVHIGGTGVWTEGIEALFDVTEFLLYGSEANLGVGKVQDRIVSGRSNTPLEEKKERFARIVATSIVTKFETDEKVLIVAAVRQRGEPPTSVEIAIAVQRIFDLLSKIKVLSRGTCPHENNRTHEMPLLSIPSMHGVILPEILGPIAAMTHEAQAVSLIFMSLMVSLDNFLISPIHSLNSVI